MAAESKGALLRDASAVIVASDLTTGLRGACASKILPWMNAEDRVTLQASDGSGATVHRHGAHVSSWVDARNRERLFTSRKTAFGGAAAIRGGIPVIFPQFADHGPLPKHGFARNRPWTLLAARSDAASFTLRDDAATRAIWPCAFDLLLDVTVAPAALEVRLSVRNRGESAFSFTAALHTYLRVDEIAHARIHGLQGLRYRDSTRGGAAGVEPAQALTIDGELDRIYLQTPDTLTLHDAKRSLLVQSRGFADAVIWNPGAEKAAALADLEEEGWRRFVCIESAVIARPVVLQPGATWTAAQRLCEPEASA